MKQYDDAIADFLANKQMAVGVSLPEGIKLLLCSLENPANLPFSRELWTYRLPENLAKINDPILVVIGQKDIQVDWKIDGEILEVVTAHKNDVSFVYPENANHLLKHEAAPREALTAQYVTLHYNASNTELDGEAENAIIRWLKEKSQK